jgi:high-affinity Fe2+/Pb2+ permease
MNTKINQMKTLSFIGMVAGLFLLVIFSFLVFLFSREMGIAGMLLITAGIILSVYVMIFSTTAAGWDKNRR